MQDATYPFGYCTNVHAGTSLEGAKSNLLQYATAVRKKVVPEGKLPIGLWLAEEAALSLLGAERLEEFGVWLSEQRFVPYTFNGFPQGDFHQRVVKHAVYEPSWKSASRLSFTNSLARIMAHLLDENATGSISTLPLGWPHQPWQQPDFQTAAKNLLELAHGLDELKQSTGREIVIAIESEPGCVLNTAAEICDFFEKHLFVGDSEDVVRRHLGVCHDICHSGVMFEPQAEVLSQYLQAGIRIGKVQVSSAVHVPWDECYGDEPRQLDVLEQLRTFDEPKYLHQATRANAQLRLDELSEDLTRALSQWLEGSDFPEHPWRVHFHVPIFVDNFGNLQTTQQDILKATRFLEQHRQDRIGESAWFTGHYEVETYAWPVLPESLAVSDLASGIAQELTYFSSVLANARCY